MVVGWSWPSSAHEPRRASTALLGALGRHAGRRAPLRAGVHRRSSRFGFVFQCIGMGVNNFIRTAGAPNRALGTMLIGARGRPPRSTTCSSSVLGWGVQGSALATVVRTGRCRAPRCCGTSRSRRNVPHQAASAAIWRLHLRVRCGTILSLGFASFAVQAGMAVVNFVLNHLLVHVRRSRAPSGADGALASIGVVQRVAMFTVLPLVGVADRHPAAAGRLQLRARHLYGRVQQDAVVRQRRRHGASRALHVAARARCFARVHRRGVRHHAATRYADFTVFALKVQLLMLPLRGLPDRRVELLPGHGAAGEVHRACRSRARSCSSSRC